MTQQLLTPPPSDTKDEAAVDVNSFYQPDRLRGNYLAWGKGALGGVLFHAGCVAAPFYFTWPAFWTTIVLGVLTGCVGITFCYHRYLSHQSFKLVGPVEFFALLCGSLAGQGPPLWWSAVHRLHHARSDLKGDPHSPTEGIWWSHVFWLFTPVSKAEKNALIRKYVPDLAKRPMLRFFDTVFGGMNSHLIQGVVLYAIGGLPFLLWAGCVRMTFALHCTWFVNSASHIWGYRNYETRDDSRNLWWVAMLTWGEGWHNNHHAYPRNAPSGHRWWELDPTWWVIKSLRFCGLAYDVVDGVPASDRGKSADGSTVKRTQSHRRDAA